MSYTYHSSVPALRTGLTDRQPRGHCSQSYGHDAGWHLTSRSGTNNTVNDQNQVTAEGAVSYTYDANGNRTSSSNYRTWTWDDENQLIGVEQFQSWKSEFTYDGRQRLRVRKEFTWNAGYGAWQLSGETRYIYDGMLLLQERNSGNVPQISYARGLDLSGTLAGAGGIGGLLARYRHATTSPYAINGASFYHADGNGNVTYLANSAGSADAAYRYDPFGRWLAQTGSYASANVMRFSSKPWIAHNGSSTDGLYYYGYRFYDPNLQRWPNRDPFGELGDFNLYRFVENDPIGYADAYGLKGPRGPFSFPWGVAKVPQKCVLRHEILHKDCQGNCRKRVCVYRCLSEHYADQFGKIFHHKEYPGCDKPCPKAEDVAKKRFVYPPRWADLETEADL